VARVVQLLTRPIETDDKLWQEKSLFCYVDRKGIYILYMHVPFLFRSLILEYKSFVPHSK
jgi:hypothetical protein